MRLTILALTFLVPSLASFLPQFPITTSDPDPGEAPKVNVTLYVMSRCPDARRCEAVFEDVLQTEGIVDKVNLNMQYIAKLNHSDPFGMTCKHGPLECLGNGHELCLASHLNLTSFYATLSCFNFHSPWPGDIGQVEFARQCLETIGEDWETSGVGRCIERKSKNGLGKEARKLLFENVRETNERGVEKSCTIEIQSTLVRGRKRTCLVDDGVWTGCDVSLV
ncbi:hypothetical protein BCR39DRAFT_532403 [Naematelia encephala]|uniref:Gamma interferon inducible lysosomal thiol reductase-domain-containing protein n=1 Tax=Naematelia encephala TaxID=71784 RepID=A0A1Y2B4D2_9TREE|nr:hypothetical protein BCR39DRAFT_532403 [Naematelia encephala]